ncbi:MAG: WXG100 family type VII secretion target [Clostridia bacterium]|nr:WXG100 family type VII secretion target [Clostridia bacterium]
MSQIIQITPEELEAKAKELDGLTAQHMEIFSKITNIINSLQGQWQGKAQQNFYTAFENSKEPMGAFQRYMESFTTFMCKAATEFRNTDQNLNGPSLG